MATSPFSVRLDDDLKVRLEKIAQTKKRSSAYVIQQALESYVGNHERFYREMEEAIAEADKGIFISEEAMHKWMESWDTENELPPPEPDIFPTSDKK